MMRYTTPKDINPTTNSLSYLLSFFLTKNKNRDINPMTN